MPLRLPALSPVAWVTAEKVTQQALWLVLFTVLAPILGPGPYGVFSIVMVFVGFCEFVLGDGAIEALLTVDELTPQYMASANLATLLLSLAVSLILFLLAPAIAVGFHAEPTPGDDGVQESHAAVSRTARTLRVGKLEAGVAKAIGQGLCGIEVGTDSVERVTAILDRLAHGLESRGLLLEPTGTGMKVAIAPDHVFFTLTERIETRKHVPTVEELAAEERLRKNCARDVRLRLWPIERKRAYSEFDHVRTGELGVQIGEQYVGGLRRAWRDGKYQRLEQLIDNVVGGIVTYLVGVKAKREEQEQWNRKWRRQEQLRVLARARAAREEDRLKFLEQLSKTWRDAERLRATLASLRTDEASNSAGELIRFSNWAEERLQRLEAKLQPCSIAAALRDERLFPEVDDLEPSAEDDEFDGSLEQARALCAVDSE